MMALGVWWLVVVFHAVYVCLVGRSYQQALSMGLRKLYFSTYITLSMSEIRVSDTTYEALSLHYIGAIRDERGMGRKA